jgi:uncharacterized membrane protein YoaK (UPF0700 family)
MRLPFYGLGFAAGALDAISFLRLGGVFTANMTANTALLGILVGTHVGAVQTSVPVAPQIVAMIALVLGAFATAPLVRGDFDKTRAAHIALVEGLLVAVASAALTWIHGPFVAQFSVAMLCAAMGAQSVLAVKAGAPGVSTALAMGTVATAIMRSFRIGTASQYGPLAAHDAAGWLAYLGGAIVGTLLLAVLRNLAMWPVVAVFAAVAALFVRR